MSAPTETRDKRRQPEATREEPTKTAPTGNSGTRADEAAVLDMQHTAGNQAVTSAVGHAPAGVQRAPKDEDDAVASIPPPAKRAPTGGAGGHPDDDAVLSIPPVPAAKKAPRLPEPARLSVSPPPANMSQFVPEEEGDEPPKPGRRTRPATWDDAREVPEYSAGRDVRALAEPGHPQPDDRVASTDVSPRRGQREGAQGLSDRGYDRCRAGLPGPATDLPNIGPSTTTGLGQPLTGAAAAGLKPPLPEGPQAKGRQDPRKDAYARGPDGQPMRRDNRTQVAQSVSDDEVRGAFSTDPGKVFRSPSMGFHLDGYRADGGAGDLPEAYRVGDIIILGPRYQVAGVEVSQLSVPGSAGAGPAGGPPAQPLRSPGPTPGGAPLAASVPQQPVKGGQAGGPDTFEDEVTQTDIRPFGAGRGAGAAGATTGAGTTGGTGGATGASSTGGATTGTGPTAGTTTQTTSGTTNQTTGTTAGTGTTTPPGPAPTIRPPWVPPRPDTLEPHPDSPHGNIIIEKGLPLDIDRVLDELDKSAGGGRIADRIRDGSLRMTFVRQLSTGDAGLHFAGGEVYVTVRGSVGETVSTIVHEGTHWLDPAAQVLGSPRGPSRLGVEAEARAFEYEHRQGAGLPAYDAAEQAYRDAYDKVLKESHEYRRLKRTSSADKVITEKDLPKLVVRQARIAADKAMIAAMRADPTRYAVEDADQERARIEARRPPGLRTQPVTGGGHRQRAGRRLREAVDRPPRRRRRPPGTPRRPARPGRDPGRSEGTRGGSA